MDVDQMLVVAVVVTRLILKPYVDKRNNSSCGAPHRALQRLALTSSLLKDNPLFLQWPVKSCSRLWACFRLTPAYDELCLNRSDGTGVSVTYTWPELLRLRTKHILLNNVLLAMGMEMKRWSEYVLENRRKLDMLQRRSWQEENKRTEGGFTSGT